MYKISGEKVIIDRIYLELLSEIEKGEGGITVDKAEIQGQSIDEFLNAIIKVSTENPELLVLSLQMLIGVIKKVFERNESTEILYISNGKNIFIKTDDLKNTEKLMKVLISDEKE